MLHLYPAQILPDDLILQNQIEINALTPADCDVLKQQHGVAKAVCRLPAWAFYLQLWLSVSAGILTYLGIFLKNSLTGDQAGWIMQLSAVLVVALLVSSVLCRQPYAVKSLRA